MTRATARAIRATARAIRATARAIRATAPHIRPPWRMWGWEFPASPETPPARLRRARWSQPRPCGPSWADVGPGVSGFAGRVGHSRVHAARTVRPGGGEAARNIMATHRPSQRASRSGLFTHPVTALIPVNPLSICSTRPPRPRAMRRGRGRTPALFPPGGQAILSPWFH
jgi:hypothetical protein